MLFQWAPKKHLAYFRHCLFGTLPSEYQGVDSNRLLLVYFSASALDLMGMLHDDNCVTREEREKIATWARGQLLVHSPSNESPNQSGFRPGPCMGGHFGCLDPQSPYDCGHLTMTYVGCLLLTILAPRDQPQTVTTTTTTTEEWSQQPVTGLPLDEAARAALVRGCGAVQLPNGAFKAVVLSSESDVRFVFSALAACHMCGDFSTIDREACIRFILSCQTYEGGFGQNPGCEAHGGTTFCSLASLKLLNALDRIPDPERVASWLLQRQRTGFMGRPNKEPDSCYTWWVGSALHMLGKGHLVSAKELFSFLNCCQCPRGGFSKYPLDGSPDVLHSHFSIAGLCLFKHVMQEEAERDPNLNEWLEGLENLAPINYVVSGRADVIAIP